MNALRLVRIHTGLALLLAVLGLSLAAVPAWAGVTSAQGFYTVTPCRVYDTRDIGGSEDPVTQGEEREIPVAGVCGIPANAAAVSFNVTITSPTGPSHVTLYPKQGELPPTSTINFVAGQTRANNIVLELYNGGIVARPTMLAPGSVHVILDVNGYFLVNAAPVVTTTAGTTAFTEDGGAVVVDSGVTVSDSDNTNLQSATVSLASAPDSPAETLNATVCAGLTVTPGNPLTITGDQPLATYEACLQSVTYDNTDQDPDTTDRTVNFVVNDGTSDSNTATKTVSVDAENDAPTITSSDTVSVPENQTSVIDVQATDPEGDTEGAGLSYSITGGADAALFSIVASTGVLTFNSAPDFESPGDAGGNNVYDVQVTVTDSGVPVQTDVQDLQVTVTSENDAPTITSSDTASVPENQTAVIDVQSTDQEDSEGAGLTYSITGGADAALFSIVASTGVLTFNSAPDFENPQDAGNNNVYDVQVTVTDSGIPALTDVQDLQVTVTDANDPPTITSSDTVNAPENQTAVIDVQSTDQDGDTEGSGLSYSITGGADAALFSIVASTGVLTFNSAPDFEAPADAGANNVYDVQVTVTDSGVPPPIQTDVQNLQVTVTDVNEAPTITSSATVSVAENQTSVIDVQSTDPDGDTEGSGLSYSITGGADAALFSIVASTGVLTFNSPPDFEAPGDAGANNVYDVQVTVTDSGVPTMTDVQNLQVTVTNANDAPTITSSATPSVPENQTAVIDVQSTDPEGQTEGAGLSYSITGGADAAKFSIVASTGVLTFISAPDFEAPGDVGANNVYDVQVTVTDSGVPVQAGVQNLQVTVTNANDAPTITSSATPSVPENQTGVIDVQSTDPEGQTEGAGLSYSITGGADAAQFSIVASTGVLTFNSAPNFEAPADAGANNVYDVQVTVTDSGVPAQAGVQNLQVTVTNVNEAPTITSSATVNVPENQTGVIDVQSTDPEGQTEGAGLSYSITGGADAAQFSIVASTGVLTFISAPNFEAPTDAGANNVYDVQVTVTDTGVPAQSGVQNLQVTVTDVNEPPTGPFNESFDTIGNTLLEVAATAAAPQPKVYFAGDLLNGETDPEGLALTVTINNANGATVNINSSTGEFTYVPVAGGTGSTNFTYNVCDPALNCIIGTATIVRQQRVWYVRNNNAGTESGRSNEPYNTLLEAQTASGPNDWIFVHFGDGTSTGHNAGIVLKAGQHLIGEHHGLTIPIPSGSFNGTPAPTNVSPFTAAPGNRPLIDHSGAGNNAVSATDVIPVEIIGLSLQSAAANAIDLTNAVPLPAGPPVPMLSIQNNVFRGAGAEGIDINLNAGTSNTLALDITGNSWDLAGTHTGNAVDINRAAGTLRLNFSNNTNVVSANAAGAAVNINGGAAASTTILGFTNNTVHQNTAGSGIVVTNATFDADPLAANLQFVSGGSTVIGASGDGVGGGGLLMSAVIGELRFADLDVFTSGGGGGVVVTGTGAFTGAAGTRLELSSVSSVDATGGPAVNINNATIDIQLSSLKSTNTTTTGVSLTNVSDGTTNAVFSATGIGSSITTAAGAAGPAFNVSGGNAKITYGGTITNNSTSARAVSISSWSGDDAVPGDDILLSGAIDENGSGILVNGNGGSRSITFSGGMDIDTTTGEGFAATSNTNTGGLHITGTNTIDSTSATGLRVTNTTIGNSNLSFQHISSGNNTAAADPANGIVLNTTGSSGSLIVTGTGAADSGGTIQNTTGHGVLLTSTLSPSFTRMKIQNTAGSGVEGTQVTNFTFVNGTVDNSGTGGGADDSNLAFNDQATGTENNLSGTVTITNNTLTNARWHGIMIQNFNGTVADAIITGNTITSSTSAATSLGYGINLQILGSATTVSNLTKATISGNNVTNFPSAGGIQVQGGNSNAAGPAGILGVAGSGSDIISIVSNQVRGQSAANRMATSAILYTVSGKGQGNVSVSNNGTLANPIGNNTGTTIGVGANGNTTLTATTSGNFVEANHPGTTGDSGISGGVGVTFGVTDVADMTWTINGNTIRNVDGNGILAVARGTNGTLKVKIQNNDVEAPQAGVRPGIRVDAGNTTAGTDNDVCLNISGNTSAGSGGSQGIGLRKQGTSTTVHAFGVNGMAATSSPGVETYVNGLNPAGNSTLLISATSGFSNCSLP